MIWYVKHTYVIWYVELLDNMRGCFLFWDAKWYAVRFSEIIGYDANTYTYVHHHVCLKLYDIKIIPYFYMILHEILIVQYETMLWN